MVKVPTRQRVLALRRDDAYMTLREIGARVGCTGERVRQILAEALLPTAALVRYVGGVCSGCNKRLLKGRTACAQCLYERNSVMVNCNACGTPLRVTRGKFALQHKPPYTGVFYCNYSCAGRVNGKISGRHDSRRRRGETAFITGAPPAHIDHRVEILRVKYLYIVRCDCGQDLQVATENLRHD
jgi:RNase P subunit RPR2